MSYLCMSVGPFLVKTTHDALLPRDIERGEGKGGGVLWLFPVNRNLDEFDPSLYGPNKPNDSNNSIYAFCNDNDIYLQSGMIIKNEHELCRAFGRLRCLPTTSSVPRQSPKPGTYRSRGERFTTGLQTPFDHFGKISSWDWSN